MDIEPLNKAETAWLKKLQKLLNECPSSRFASYTTGDSSVTVYDVSVDSSEAANNLAMNNDDWCHLVSDFGAELFSLKFPFAVHSTAG